MESHGERGWIWCWEEEGNETLNPQKRFGLTPHEPRNPAYVSLSQTQITERPSPGFDGSPPTRPGPPTQGHAPGRRSVQPVSMTAPRYALAEQSVGVGGSAVGPTWRGSSRRPTGGDQQKHTHNNLILHLIFISFPFQNLNRDSLSLLPFENNFEVFLS